MNSYLQRLWSTALRDILLVRVERLLGDLVLLCLANSSRQIEPRVARSHCFALLVCTHWCYSRHKQDQPCQREEHGLRSRSVARWNGARRSRLRYGKPHFRARSTSMNIRKVYL